jgi:hypothetical protein
MRRDDAAVEPNRLVKRLHRHWFISRPVEAEEKARGRTATAVRERSS